MASLVNNCVFVATAGGTAAFGVSVNAQGYQTPAAAGAIDGKTYRYRAQSADLSQWEEGSTVPSGSATSFTRTVTASSAGGTTTVNFTQPPNVILTVFVQDILQFDDPMSLTTAQKDQGRRNLSVTGGGISNLVSYNTGANTATLTADAVALFDGSGNMFGATSVSLSLNIAAAGANGLDTGALATTGYHYFVIYNPATNTVAGLYSLSATAPTMPSGYTYKRRVGWIYYSAGITGYVQRNRQFAYASQRGVVSGIQTAAAYFSLNGFAPPTASIIRGVLASNNNNVMVGDNAGNVVIQVAIPGGTASYWFFEFVVQNTTFQIYYSSSSSGGQTLIQGWEDNI